MSTHPWIGLPAGAGSIHGLVLAVGVDTVAITESDGHTSTVPLHRLRPDDPAEARRRLEAAGAATPTVQAEPAPVDYEAIGRGMAREVFEYMAIQRGTHAIGVLDIIGQAIGKGIGSARGGGA